MSTVYTHHHGDAVAESLSVQNALHPLHTDLQMGVDHMLSIFNSRTMVVTENSHQQAGVVTRRIHVQTIEPPQLSHRQRRRGNLAKAGTNRS